MTALLWDQVGNRRYESGVDRGVLYLTDGRAVPWNGITSVDEDPNHTSESLYLDGVKFLERVILGDFSGKLKAFTYPEEFEEVSGMTEIMDGLFYHNQAVQPFHLSYRTKLGDDVEGLDLGYRIHILYNLIAVPDTVSHQTLGNSTIPTDFSWAIKGIPKIITGTRPTTHISIDSTRTDPERLAAIERFLYGTADSDPTLPAIDVFTTVFDSYNDLTIVDNGDGTWTAYDPGDSHITMTSPTEFLIDEANVVYSDPDTYTISDTDPDDA